MAKNKTKYQIERDKFFTISYKKHYKQLKEGLGDIYQELKDSNQFKGRFKSFIKELSKTYKGRTIETRIQGILRREEFISKEQRGLNNLIKGLKSQHDYREFKKDFGWKKEMNLDNIKYDKDLHAYIYTNKDGKKSSIHLEHEGADSQFWVWKELSS